MKVDNIAAGRPGRCRHRGRLRGVWCRQGHRPAALQPVLADLRTALAGIQRVWRGGGPSGAPRAPSGRPGASARHRSRSGGPPPARRPDRSPLPLAASTLSRPPPGRRDSHLLHEAAGAVGSCRPGWANWSTSRRRQMPAHGRAGWRRRCRGRGPPSPKNCDCPPGRR